MPANISVKDPASAANFQQLSSEHIDLELDVDFEGQQVDGNAKIDLARHVPASEIESVVLDVFKLDVKSVKLCGKEAGFEVAEFTGFGAQLRISVDGIDEEDREREVWPVEVAYRTQGGPALSFLAPAQTASKTHPFLFTQGQACLNRSLFPCQDAPAVRQTYSARVTVPAGMTAVMSAKRVDADAAAAAPEGSQVFAFEMEQCIPSYLIALAVGLLESREIGPRSSVFAEPPLVEAAQKEFEGVTEEYLAAGEALFGPYLWERYDILVMPPSFPFGGMENPRCTFVTPCLLCGDRSLTDVIAHEIAHSWTGNLVTNATWSDFFLNEGFTMYAQRRITTKVHGEAFTALEAMTGAALLRADVEAFGADSPLTRLRVPLAAGVDPEDTYNETPYEKGFCLVSYLRSLRDSDEEFDAWLQSYATEFAFRSITAEDMFEFFLSSAPGLREAGVETREGLEFETWLHQPGLPPFQPDLSAGKELAAPAEAEAKLWTQAPAAEASMRCDGSFASWPTYQKLHMLDTLVEASPLADSAAVPQLDELRSLSASPNAEVRLRFSLLILKNGWNEGFASIGEFLRSQGKLKYTVPLYRAMVKLGTAEALDLAKKTFAETEAQLHDQVRNYVSRILADA